jgi:hypothetical protein
VVGWDGSSLKFDKLGPWDPAGAEDGNFGQRTANHGDLVACVEAWAGLAVFIDLVGQRRAVDDAEVEVNEKVGDAGKEADGRNLLLFGFFQQSAEELAACALAFRLRLDHDGTDLGEVGTIEMERAAAKEGSDVGFGDREVADVLADLGIVAAEQGAIMRERVDEVEDVRRIGEFGWAHDDCGKSGGLGDRGLKDTGQRP